MTASGSKTTIKNTTLTKKPEIPKLPKGSTEISRECNVEVEEIENGFLISKRVEIKYQASGKEYTDWLSYTKKWYSEENPISVTTDTKDKSLADIFDE